MEVALGSYYGALDDVLQVLSMPVFMIEQALFSMQDAKEKGQQQEKKDKTDLILEILGFVLMFVPFVDEFAPELEFLDGIGTMVSTVADVAFTIQGIISSPASAPIQILGLLAGGGGRSRRNSRSSRPRDGVSGRMGEKMGDIFKKTDDEFQGIAHKSCRI